ncbi:MAG: epoxyqueuosine reductase [Chloroflexota bacterium]
MNQQADPAEYVAANIREFASSSPLNRLSLLDNKVIFDEPLVRYADGDDPIFRDYKDIIDPTHLTPRELMSAAFPGEPTPEHVSVVSWILPVTARTRESNRRQNSAPSRLWAFTRFYGEQFNDALREYVVSLISEMGYRAAAPLLQDCYDGAKQNEKGRFSNWSERHAAYAAGQGTFSLSDGLITDRGIAHRCGTVVTDLSLPASPRTATGPYTNCLFYQDGSCGVCIQRCPAGAITREGHDKHKCREYLHVTLRSKMKKYNIGIAGCGLCQTKVPCEWRNPAGKKARPPKAAAVTPAPPTARRP